MKIFFFIHFLIISSCSHHATHDPRKAMRIYKKDITLQDDLELAPLIRSLKKTAVFLEQSNKSLTFGTTIVTANDYRKIINQLIKCYQQKPNKDYFLNLIKENFNIHEVYGRKNIGEILLTSYFAPMIEGRKAPSRKYYIPIYSTPLDLVEIQIKNYPEENYGVLEERDVLTGRIVKSGPSNKKGASFKIEPYYSREEIDSLHYLKGKGLEIAYVDPIDAFFLHIQGSGSIKLKNKDVINVGYSTQNGMKYVPIGKFLLDKIPLEEMSLQKIKKELRLLTKQDLHKLLNKNPSYIFFRQLDNNAITTSGLPALAGRTLAVDQKLFPLGAIGWIKFQQPVFSDDDIFSLKSTARIIVNHDTGGAIKGSGRADLFWGTGKLAGKHAGVMKHSAHLYYFTPKANKINSKLCVSN
jgi:membrane-bound lytic murein transglycosylase A